MAEENSIEILVKAEVAKAVSGLVQVQNETKKVKGSAESLGSSFVSVGNIIKGVLLGVVGKAFKDVTKLAIDFLDLQGDFNSAFSGIEDSANKMRDSLVASLGLSTKGATELLLKTGLLSQNLGFAKEESLKFSGEVLKLAEALSRSGASNLGTAETANVLTRALAGQTRGLVSLGIKIDDTEIKQQALKDGLGGTTGELTQQERAQVVLEIATRKSSGALKDLESGQLSLQDKLKVTSNRFEDVRLALGLELLKVVQPAIDKFIDLASTGDTINTWGLVFRKALQGVILLFNISTAPIQFMTRQLINLGETFFNVGKVIAESFHLGDVIKQITDFTSKISSGKLGFNDIAKEFVKLNTGIADSLTKGLDEGAVGKIFGALKDGAKGAADAVLDQGKTIANGLVKLVTDLDKNTDQSFKNVKANSSQTNKQVVNDVQLSSEQIKAITLAVANFALSTAATTTAIIEELAQRSIDTTNTFNDELLALDADRRAVLAERNTQDYNKNIDDLKAQLDTETDEKKRAALQQQIDRTKQDKIYDDAKAALEIRAREREKEIKRKQWQASHDAAVAAAIITAAQATLAAFASGAAIPVGGIVAGPAFAAVAAALGAVQVGIIASQSVPEFALGGLAGLQGPQLISAGERGPEAVLPAELTALLMRAASSNTNNDNRTINFTANGVQNPAQFVNQAQRVFGDNFFSGAR